MTEKTSPQRTQTKQTLLPSRLFSLLRWETDCTILIDFVKDFLSVPQELERFVAIIVIV